jgi:predicted dehydrogenase
MHGTNLAHAVIRSSGLRFVSCADPDSSAAERAASLAGDVHTYPSIEALLDSSDVDAVMIATPHDFLAPAALSALRAGKHVLLEKPMALNDREAQDIESAAVSAGVNCMVGYSLRFSIGRHVRDLIAAGAVGDIEAVGGSIGIPPMNRSWMARPERGGGPLFYVGCHLVDFLLWFTGDEPTSVFANLRRRADTGTDELTALQIQLTRGAIAQLSVSQTAASFGYDFNIHGRAGDIAIRGRNLFQLELSVLSTALPGYGEPTVIYPVVRGDAIASMLIPEVEEFRASIGERRAPSITPADGRRVLKVLDAAIESASSGQVVRVETPAFAAR